MRREWINKHCAVFHDPKRNAGIDTKTIPPENLMFLTTQTTAGPLPEVELLHVFYLQAVLPS